MSNIIASIRDIFSSKPKRPDSYNMLRGMQALQGGNLDEARHYLALELQDNPRNGYAHYGMGDVCYRSGDLAHALSAFSAAIQMIPSADIEYMACAYSNRAKIFHDLREEDKALADLDAAILRAKGTAKECDFLMLRARLHFGRGEYGLAENDYHRVVALQEWNMDGHAGLAFVALARGHYDLAVRLCGYVLKLAPDHYVCLTARADGYVGLKKYREAADDIVAAVRTGRCGLDFVGPVAERLAEAAPDALLARLKSQNVCDPNPVWTFMMGAAYQTAGRYRLAVDCYEEVLSENPADEMSVCGAAECYLRLGQCGKALKYANQLVARNPGSVRALCGRAMVESRALMWLEAIADYSASIALAPDYAPFYYWRGIERMRMKDNDGAIEDFSSAVALAPATQPYALRAEAYLASGERAKAEADYREAIRLSNAQSPAPGVLFAYLFLGEKDKAAAALEHILNENVRNDKNEDNLYLYCAAAFCSMLGDATKAIGILQKILERDLSFLPLIDVDDKLDNIRDLDEFKRLISAYKSKCQAEAEAEDSAPAPDCVESEEEIPFIREGGGCKVKCKINGLPLHFVFDTGASDVSISSVEANFMAKNDFLAPSDILGTQYYRNASGDLNEGTVINIREVQIGSLRLNNVRASVVKSQAAPLLLGQSVISRLGKIEIDNEGGFLRIRHRGRS